MICDEDPLRRRPRESTARRKRQERCVWMARKMTEWPSKRGPITKIMPSDGCIGDTVPLAVGKWYEFHEFGWHMGNVGLVVFPMFSSLSRPYRSPAAPSAAYTSRPPTRPQPAARARQPRPPRLEKGVIDRVSRHGEAYRGEGGFAILRDDEDDLNDQDGSSGRNKHEQGANSARHGLLRGAGADELAHQQR